jgi:aspartate dehydrogenase
MKTIHFGIIGCGAIGSEIAKAIDRGIISGELVAICDLDEERAKNLVSKLTLLRRSATQRQEAKPKIVNLDNLMKMVDFVIESAHPDAVKEIWNEVLKVTRKGKKRSVLIMSIGGLLCNPEIILQAREKKINLYLPSGAVAGIDALKAGGMGGISSVTLVTSKPPAGLKDAPYLKNSKIDISKFRKKTLIFEGNTLEAIKGFPANINVAGVLSLAGIGAKKTKVKIFADPNLKRNVHEIIIEGDFGKITTRTENLPSAVNPKTSQLAILSAIATLKQVSDSVKIGI